MRCIAENEMTKGKNIEESRSTPFPTPIRSPRIHDTLVSSDTEKLQELTAISIPSPSLSSSTIKLTPAVRPRDQDYPHDDAHHEGENSAKWQKMSEYGAYISGESSSGQVNESNQGLSSSGNQEQVDDYDFWTDSYALDDDEIPTRLVSQDIMDEVSLTIDEAMLKKVANEMLRQRCISGDEHQYHIDQMKKFLESDIVWENRKEILVFPHLRKATLLVQSCQRDPKAPALSLINQDLLYLKKGSSRSEKIVLSLYKFPTVIFNDDDIEERTSRWKEPGKAKEVVYSNSKIIQFIKTYWELGHEHKFITEIVARRANECIVLITEPDFKNLNKNDIEDMYLLIINGKLIKEDVEYLQLFEEEIDKRLKNHNQMRCWEMYVNGRPLGPRRDRPE
ncbi:hypothetical protein Tco_0143506 [Tanacetum coccineum]